MFAPLHKLLQGLGRARPPGQDHAGLVAARERPYRIPVQEGRQALGGQAPAVGQHHKTLAAIWHHVRHLHGPPTAYSIRNELVSRNKLSSAQNAHMCHVHLLPGPSLARAEHQAPRVYAAAAEAAAAAAAAAR